LEFRWREFRIFSNEKYEGAIGIGAVVKWSPSLGAVVQAKGVNFEVWAPEARSIEVVLEKESGNKAYSLQHFIGGKWKGFIPGLVTGELYRYRIDGDRCLPDPASRFQPQGVHGPSQVIDPQSFQWTDHNWGGVARQDLIFYELHVGTFTPEGTFQSTIERLPYLADLGITAVELMPVADFPGERNWGYDGVDLFAPAHCYGSPDDLRKLVDAAHHLGLAVFLDVVYNHFGPDGAYAPSFSRYYFSARHKTPWGDAINMDGAYSPFVREFFIENALYWIHEFHMDGLRLDATHAIIDESPRPFLVELSSRLHASEDHRTVILIAEDHRNLAHMVQPEVEGGWCMDGLWSDDFHHQLRVLFSGYREGYFCDFSGTTADLAETLQKGWYFAGQHSKYFEGPRGSDPTGVTPERFVIFLQNHDQVGNRAFGDRLHHQIDEPSYRAATVLLLCAPYTPLLFMGQEWAAGTPFCYFTDHNEELGRLVTEGRRKEFARFSAFSDSRTRENIPDPQDPDTFNGSRIIWAENKMEPHASILRLYQSVIALRKTDPALRSGTSPGHYAIPLTDRALLLQRKANDSTVFVVVQLKGSDTLVIDLPQKQKMQVLLTTEDRPFASDPAPISIEQGLISILLHFSRPGAVVLKS